MDRIFQVILQGIVFNLLNLESSGQPCLMEGIADELERPQGGRDIRPVGNDLTPSGAV